MALVLTRLVRSNYNELDNIPIIHQDLTASFTKQADTYYIHTGSTTSAYIKGRMYYCDGTNLKKLIIVDEVNDGKLTITVNGTAHTFTANQSGNTSFSITDTGATSVEVTGTGNAITAASYNASTRKITLTKGTDFMPKSGGTFTGEVKFGSTENFQGYYIKRMIGSLGAGTAYNNLDSKYKDGTYHRMWRLRFPSGSSFWGKIKVTLYGGYSSFNASGVMSKSVTCNFNTSNIYNNVGCYDGLGVNVEQDFRISEAIWNATVSAWEVLIWQKNLNGNNSPTIMLECWTANNTNYINAFNGIAAQTVELTQSTSYSAQRASSTGGTKTVEWATLPVYENPLGEEIATVAMLKNKQDKLTAGSNITISGNTISATDTGATKVEVPTTGNALTGASYDSSTRKITFTKGTFLTSHQSIKKLNTNNTLPYDVNSNESITGEGVINLHKIAKTGLYDDLRNKPSNATTSSAGLMSAADKEKLDGIATGANAYVLPSANSDRLGGIKISFSNGVLTISTQ